MKYEISEKCPDSPLVFNNGISVIDYSKEKTKYQAYLKHIEIYGDCFSMDLLENFDNYSHNDLLSLVEEGIKWPLYFEWVKQYG